MMINLGAMITLGDLEHLRHTVGAGSSIPGYRNHFVPSDAQMESMRRLEDAGLVTTTPGSSVYRATKDGCIVVGLNPIEVRRALDEETDDGH